MPKTQDEKLALCVREKGNWAKLEKEHRFDNAAFSAKQMLKDLQTASPKLAKLLETIKELDASDKEKYGKQFKHFIYSDIKSPYGAKLIAAGLLASGFKHAYNLKGTGFAMESKGFFSGSGTRFATLTSTPLYGKPIGVRFRKELLKAFNARPDNVHGENIRIIVLDSGFREGIDLFDVKYVHLFEPIITMNDQKQAIGRATRYCGQKGLTFDPVRGWPLHVYKYETAFTHDVKRHMEIAIPSLASADTFFSLFMHYSNLDPRKLNFANELVSVVTEGTIDKEYTKNIHDFKIIDGGAARRNKPVANKYLWPPVKVESMCDKPQSQSLSFTPTQELIRDTFTPSYNKNGMLLFHSVGTGKTCTAIATASSSFEPEDYTIIYVTRYTLKADVWKNMFDQVCSLVVQQYLKSGKSLPDNHAARLRLISKKWFEPMSYRQFSNMLSNKSQLHADLQAINGTKDILRKTLVIVDEAHKLFAADVEGQEKADIDVIRKAFHHSYETSGKESVKILLMTATPFTSDPMDMMRLLNLLRPPNDTIPDSFEEFSEVYLDDAGAFSVEGKMKFLDSIRGFISYLNREKDIRSFAHAVFHTVEVPMSTYEFKQEIEDYVKVKIDVDNKTKQLTQLMENGDSLAKFKENMERLLEVVNESYHMKLDLFNQCVEERGVPQTLTEVKAGFKDAKTKCTNNAKMCVAAVKDLHKHNESELKARFKGGVLKQKISELKADTATRLEECAYDKKECIENVKTRQDKAVEDAKERKNGAKEKCMTLKKEATEFKKTETKLIRDDFKEKKKQHNDEIKPFMQEKKDLAKELRLKKKTMVELVKADKSQQSAMEQCFKGIKPKFPTMVETKIDLNMPFVSRESSTSAIRIDKAYARQVAMDAAVKRNVYIINGHGGEVVVPFDQRVQLPKGKILIVFPSMSQVNYLSTICRFIALFKDMSGRDMLMNPAKHRNKIQEILDHQIRIFLPGEFVPKIFTDLFLVFPKRDETVLFKSGVYRYNDFKEVDRTIIPQSEHNLGTDECFPYCGAITTPLDYNRKVHKEIFRGNLYEPASKASSFKEMTNRRFELTNILDSMGNGVFYYMGCRKASDYDKDIYNQALPRSDQQQGVTKDDEFSITLRTPPRFASSTSVRPLPPPSPPPQPQSRARPVKSRMKLNKKEVKKFTDDIQIFVDPLFGPDKIIGKTFYTSLSALRQRADTFPKTSRIVMRLNNILDLAEYVAKTKGDEKVRLDVNLSMDGSTKVYLYNVYKFKRKTFKLNEKLHGVIPNHVQSRDFKACNSEYLGKKVVALYRKGVSVDLPKTIDEWYTHPGLFDELCGIARRGKV